MQIIAMQHCCQRALTERLDGLIKQISRLSRVPVALMFVIAEVIYPGHFKSPVRNSKNRKALPAAGADITSNQPEDFQSIGMS